jgi:hypothetical protein
MADHFEVSGGERCKAKEMYHIFRLEHSEMYPQTKILPSGESEVLIFFMSFNWKYDRRTVFRV